MLRSHRSTLAFILLSAAACAPPNAADVSEGVGAVRSSLTAAERRARVTIIRDVAAEEGMTEGYLLAGIANSESSLSQCYSERPHHCQGPRSPDCDGPVLAGSGDGACSLHQGGLGMFQFDAGTHSQTLARYGSSILTVAGSTRAAVDFAVKIVLRSEYISGVETREEAIEWMNGVRVGGSRWDPWLRTVVRYYNGCRPTASCWANRYPRYRDRTLQMVEEFGAGFWNLSEPADGAFTDGGVFMSDASMPPIESDAGTPVVAQPDRDGDGFAEGVDCDDTASSINPEANDICGDAIDQNCDGEDAMCGTEERGSGELDASEPELASGGCSARTTSFAPLLLAVALLRRRRR